MDIDCEVMFGFSHVSLRHTMSYAEDSISRVSILCRRLCAFMCTRLSFLFDVLKIEDPELLLLTSVDEIDELLRLLFSV